MDVCPHTSLEVSAKEPMGERAAWMAGIGGFVLNQTVREYLSTFSENISDDGIIRVINSFDMLYASKTKSSTLQASVNERTLYYLTMTTLKRVRRVPEILQDNTEFQDKLSKYNFLNNMESISHEALISLKTLPLNVLLAAEKMKPDTVNSTYSSVGHIPSLYRAPWFKNIITNASMTANGVWRSFSNSHQELPDDQENVLYSSVVDFDYYTTNEGTQAFRFSKRAKEILSYKMQQRNESSRVTGIESSEAGSTIGCPAARRGYTFASDEEIEMLADAYEITPEQVMSRQPSTTISFGLDKFADHLDRFITLTDTK